MNIIDIIDKKKRKLALTNEEIHYMIEGYVNEEIKDYQMSALLMAIVLNGMNEEETFALTKEMVNSGDVIDLSSINGIKIDKHSTGGVGDKTSLALIPMVSACGVKCAKMSGRGLGHTGGTLDKLESIENFQIGISEDEFIKQVNEIGLAIIGQTKNLVPADKKLYALRDVTATVDCLPLIASSIMSKKIASGADTILLDVKCGNGAFMKTIDDAKSLAGEMIKIGNSFDKDVKAIITNMNRPLGLAIGNALEVKEAINTLKGEGPEDFTYLCLKAGSVILQQAKIVSTLQEGEEMLKEVISNGKALEKLRLMV
ncbi:MAG: thymidine phosphorylase, partial [Erysipelotrichaceae bacterium]